MKAIAMLITALYLVFDTASAAGPKTPGGETLKESYYWYDGDQRREVWLNPNMIAEFNPGPAGRAAIKGLIPGAKRFSKKPLPMVRLWQVEAPDGTVESVRMIIKKFPAGRFSPVFHDTSSSSGRMRALFGNIIVYLRPEWDEATVSNWAKSHGLEVIKRLKIGKNAYLIKTEPGMAALETANSIYESGEVVAAFPDWWQEVKKR